MPGQNLTREEAATRADLLTVHSYDVVLDLASGPTSFATRSTVRFSAREGAETFIDFVGESVEAVILNGRRLDPATAWADARITLTELAAENELVVEATATDVFGRIADRPGRHVVGVDAWHGVIALRVVISSALTAHVQRVRAIHVLSLSP